MNSKHTPGPWRWEVNEKFKSVSLCGGKPQFDKTVMDFVRWGMSGAAPRFLTNEIILERIDSFAVPHPERKHHASWFKIVNHPDACLIAAAPELYFWSKELLAALPTSRDWLNPDIEQNLKSAIAKATAP
jgi:hypothetical protein